MRRTTLLRLMLSPALAVTPAALRAQAPAASPVTIGHQLVVHSAVLGEDRPVLIHLPRSYFAPSRTRYPVLYVLDGDAHFASVSAMTDFLAGNGRVPEMIVVALPNTADRTRDLTPPADGGTVRLAVTPRDTVVQRFPTAGGSARLRRFITTELAPWVGSHYRAAPYRVLVGHSFGGLFVLDALAADPHAFNAYVAISPSLWWDGGKYVRRLETTLGGASLDGASLYMTTGEREGGSMIDPARELATSLAASRAPGFRSWYKVMPTESHGSNPLRTTYDALERIFDGWEAPEQATLAAAFAATSRRSRRTMPH